MEKDSSTLKPDAAADHHAITPTTRSSLSDPAELDKTTLVSRFNRSVSYSKARQDGKIELKGWSYSGGGNWVERVEVSPDGYDDLLLQSDAV